MKNMTNVIVAVVGLGMVAVAAYGIMTFSALKQTEVKNEGRYQCAVSSRYESKVNEETTVWYPVDDLYQKCLSEKGL